MPLKLGDLDPRAVPAIVGLRQRRTAASSRKDFSGNPDEKSRRQVVEDGYEFFAKRQLVTLFSAPNYCGEFDNAGAMMSVDDTLMCSFQVR